MMIKDSVAKMIARLASLFSFGGVVYFFLFEGLWRGYLPHPVMILIGGLMFVVIGGLNNYLPWDMPLSMQAVIGAISVTAVEFVSGLILNIWLGWNVWDYSSVPGNVMGQICPLYTFLWIPCSLLAIWVDDWMRYLLFEEARPHYFWI